MVDHATRIMILWWSTTLRYPGFELYLCRIEKTRYGLERTIRSTPYVVNLEAERLPLGVKDVTCQSTPSTGRTVVCICIGTHVHVGAAWGTAHADRVKGSSSWAVQAWFSLFLWDIKSKVPFPNLLVVCTLYLIST